MSMYQHPAYPFESDASRKGRLLSLARKVWITNLMLSANDDAVMNERRPLDLRDGSPDLDGLHLVNESSKYSVKILGDEVLPNGFTAKGKPCLFENGKPFYVAKNTKNMLSALAAMEKV